MIFAMSDIHGHFELMKERIDQIIPYLKEGNHKLVLLGNYIGRGKSSFQCLKAAFDLQKELGEDKVIVLKGNNEESFATALYEDGVWLAIDDDSRILTTFLTKEQLEDLKKIPAVTEQEHARLIKYGIEPDPTSLRGRQSSFMKECARTNDRKLISWMWDLECFYETATQIFVHAGVDENIPEDEIEECTLRTPEYVLTGKYPPTKGHFYKDIIAGHVATSVVANDPNFEGIYFDGESHFYINGTTICTNRLLCLAYNEDTKEYYEFMEDGTFKKIEK